MMRAGPGRIIAVWVFACLGCAGTPLTTKPSVDPTGWRELRAPYFTLTSNASEKVLRDLATDLERFILIVQEIANFKVVAPPQPPRIFAFRSNADVRELAGHEFIAGMAVSGVDGSFVFFGVEGYRDTVRQILYHEFVHYLLFSLSSRSYPLWYHEGLAEMLSTIRVRDDALAVGFAPAERRQTFLSDEWMPLEEVLDASSTFEMGHEQASLFYAQSWAFVHFLHLRRPEDLQRFLAQLARTRDWRVAFERSFEADVETLDQELHDYWLSLRSGVPSMHRRAPDPNLDPAREIAAVPPSSAAYRLAELGLAMDRHEIAQPLLEYALRLDPENAPTRAALAWCLALAGDEARSESAIALATRGGFKDAKVALFTGRAQLAQAEALEGEPRRAQLEEARRALRHSTELSPNSPAGFASLGLSYVEAGVTEQEITQGIDALETAHRMLPDQAEILFGLAWLQAQRGETDNARATLERAIALSHLTELSEEMQALIDALWPDESP